jgi:hypothetical protein
MVLTDTDDDPCEDVQFGILGASRIAPVALIAPARSNGSPAVIRCIAARDRSRAQAFADRYDVEHVYDDYEAVLQDEAVTAVYIALPNSMHCEWTCRAMAHGKHVLIEKVLRHPHTLCIPCLTPYTMYPLSNPIHCASPCAATC